MNKINHSPSINFTSLKPQKRLGEEVLREFQNEMGDLKSSSNLYLRIVKKGKNRNEALIKSLEKKQLKLQDEIYDSFLNNDAMDKSFKTYTDFKKQLINNIKEKGNKANCWEDMMIVYTKLLEKGENPRNFEVQVFSEAGGCANHYSTVIGLKEDADITNPKTWGAKALIVDAWAKIVKPATEALEDIKTTLLAGRKLGFVEYDSAPNISVIKKAVS